MVLTMSFHSRTLLCAFFVYAVNWKRCPRLFCGESEMPLLIGLRVLLMWLMGPCACTLVDHIINHPNDHG